MDRFCREVAQSLNTAICTRFVQKVPGLGGYLKMLTFFHSDI